MTKPNRRSFLLGAPAAAAAATLLDGCKKHESEDPFKKALNKPPVPGSAGKPKGFEETISSVCGQCPAGCAINVRVVQGRAVGVSGIEAYPINRGTVGPKGQSGTEMLYHRDRIKTAMKREGGKGGKLVPVAWDAAIAEISGHLKMLREKNEARSVVLLSGEARGPMRDLWTRFGRAYGTPNVFDHRGTSDGAKAVAALAMQGVYELPAIDWDRTSYVLGFGTSHLESWCQTIHMMRAASSGRRGMPGKRVKFVNVSPRYSVTSMKADEWFAIEPGTYGALALGLCHVLVRDKLYDEKFVAEHAFGFEDFKGADGKMHRGFKDVVLKEGALEKVAALTQVAVEDIERIAHDMVEFKPAVVVPDPLATATSNGLFTAMSIHALNALLGSIERPGGLLVQERAPLAAWKNVELDEVAKAGLAATRLDGVGAAGALLRQSSVHRLPQALLDQKPYAAGAVFLHQSNPGFSKPDSKKWLDALAKTPLVVSFSPLPDESTQVADYVLPDHTYFERWEYVEAAPALGAPAVGLRQPAVKPVFDTQPTGEVLLKIAKAIGGPVAAAFEFDSYRAAMEERLEGLCKQDGASSDAEDLDGLIESMQTNGGWWRKAPRYEKFDFPTPSKKFEFYSQTMAGALKAAGLDTDSDLKCLPHHQEPVFAGDAKKYPFVLLPYRAINYAEGGVRHSRRLVSLPLVDGNPYRDRVELSESDARKLALRDGEKVVVETEAGSRELFVLVRPGIRPGTLGLALGHGVWPPKPGEASSALGLLAPGNEDVHSGTFALTGTRAMIRRPS